MAKLQLCLWEDIKQLTYNIPLSLLNTIALLLCQPVVFVYAPLAVKEESLFQPAEMHSLSKYCQIAKICCWKFSPMKNLTWQRRYSAKPETVLVTACLVSVHLCFSLTWNRSPTLLCATNTILGRLFFRAVLICLRFHPFVLREGIKKKSTFFRK